MATYAIGDIQGCYGPLQALLRRVGFRASRDRLWLAGDLVNRGPRSLDVLRWVMDNSDAITAVLGNHDLHLLARALGVSPARKRDTLEELLAAPDRGDLVAWLRRQPLLAVDGDRAMLHAGLLPSWNVAEASSRSREVESLLSSEKAAVLLRALHNDGAPHPDAPTRAVETARVMTRLRALDASGAPLDRFDDAPEKLPAGACPWFAAPDRASADHTLIFGHWAALGLWIEERVLALDSGCVWGGLLTAVRLEDRAVFSVSGR
ncbi:MAG: symmetrical bis(5'-nucleosyl)-tetraphosphatase [Deltaproteobacteria bacterium]|nr:symmetrical bis(5'-nucleosyl)-tetraphosphatase [Deltaproteobacteria bacterium]